MNDVEPLSSSVSTKTRPGRFRIPINVQAGAAVRHARAAALVPVATGLHPTMGKSWWSMQGESARLPEVIDSYLTTGHDQLEPALGIGEDANVLQWVSLDDE